jgi:steroid Delta-isomerase
MTRRRQPLHRADRQGQGRRYCALYGQDAIVEDPVGGEVYRSRDAAFQFRLTVGAGDSGMQIEPIDMMVLNDDVKVTAMKACWSAANVTAL